MASRSRKFVRGFISIDPSNPLTRVDLRSLGYLDTVPGKLFGASGTSAASVAETNIATDGNAILSAAWICALPFVPLILDLVRGPRNGVSVCLFAWTICSLFFIMVWSLQTTTSKWACAILNGVVSGVTAPLGFTGTEVYAERTAVLLAREEFASKTHMEKDGRPATKAEIIVARRAREGELMDRLVGILFGVSGVINILIQVPASLGLLDNPESMKALHALITFTSLLALGFLLTLSVPDLPEQDHGESKKDADKSKSGCFGAGGVGTRLISVGLALCEYRGMAFLAIGGWFFFQAFGNGYVVAYLQQTYCFMGNPPTGLGLDVYTQLNYAPMAVNAAAMFLIPFCIGKGRFQLPGYCTIMMICNLLNAIPIAIAWGSIAAQADAGGAGNAGPSSAAASAFCSSKAMFLVTNCIYQLAYAIYSVTSVAAVASWFGGARAVYVPAALAAREMFNQAGSLVSNAVFKENVFALSNGSAAPLMCLIFQAISALCIFSAYKISDIINSPEANARRAAAKAAREAKLAKEGGMSSAGSWSFLSMMKDDYGSMMVSVRSGNFVPEEIAELTVVKPLGSASTQGLDFAAEGVQKMAKRKDKRMTYVDGPPDDLFTGNSIDSSANESKRT